MGCSVKCTDIFSALEYLLGRCIVIQAILCYSELLELFDSQKITYAANNRNEIDSLYAFLM